MFSLFSKHQINATDPALRVAQREIRQRLKWAVISIMVMLILGAVNVPVGYEWFKVGLNACMGFIAINLIIFLKRAVSIHITIANCAVEFYRQIAEDALDALRDRQADK
ncbi:MAG: hypothetical protein ACRC1V_06110 [Plesiomonas sp.]